MATNTLRTRIQLKYDTLSNWNASTFHPLAGEVCVAVIPNATANDYTVGSPNATGLSPYAIGMKVGDGSHTFAQLPWIQAIAGDVYGWAKAADRPSATNITVDYDSTADKTIQEAITAIKTSLGNIVTQGVDADTLGEALHQLQEQLAGQSSTVFDSDSAATDYSVNDGEDGKPVLTHNNPTKIIRTIVQEGLNITSTSSELTEDDLPSISLNKITGLVFNTPYNVTTNKAATIADIDSRINDKLSKAMNFIGVSSTEITDGGTQRPTINGAAVNELKAGDVVLYSVSKTVGTDTVTSDLEFVWTGTAWELIGDEGSYAIRGSIKKTDLTADLQNEISGKLNSTDAANTYVAKNGTDRLITAIEATKLSGIEEGAEENVIESVSVNGAALTVTNKGINVDIPLIGLQQHSVYGNTNTTADVTPTNRKVVLDEIAYNGEVRNLKQTDNTYLVFYCGNADTDLFE